MKCGAGIFQLQLPPNVRLQGFKGGKGGKYLFSDTFWHLENAEQHVCRFLAHPNVLLKGF